MLSQSYSKPLREHRITLIRSWGSQIITLHRQARSQRCRGPGARTPAVEVSAPSPRLVPRQHIVPENDCSLLKSTVTYNVT